MDVRDSKDRRKTEPIFPHYQVVTLGALTARFRSLAKRAGFEGLRLHDRRHAFCSRLVQALRRMRRRAPS